MRTLQPGQRCEVWIVSVTGERRLACSTDNLLLEAPNWTLDGDALILNGDGKLWRLDATAGASPEAIPLTGVPDLNNDHVLDPDGKGIYVSANDGHIYRAALAGGAATRITADDGTWHFLHGVSPDGAELAYVGLDGGFTQPGRLMTIPAAGGPPEAVDVGAGHCDGPEYSPDGTWIYLNTESFTTVPGHAQLARVRRDGGGFERLVASETVDWFPHLSPDGRFASYLRFPQGTEGHPADLPVDVVLVSTSEWETPLHAWPLFGGQGTLNVNSWSPDSTRFAYVAYPLGG